MIMDVLSPLVKLRSTTTRVGMWVSLRRNFSSTDSSSTSASASALMGELSKEILGAREWLSMPWTAVSFFKFMPPGKMKELSSETVTSLLAHIKSGLAGQGVKGTFVLSHEGYNCALIIPTERLQGAYNVLQTADNSLTFEDGAKLFQGTDWNIGDSSEYGDEHTALAHNIAVMPIEPFPFKKLIVRTKESVLTDKLPDGLGATLDWSDSGPVLSPQQWHEKLAELSGAAGAGSSSAGAGAGANASNSEASTTPTPTPIVLDCRNTYESAEGAFVGSVPLGTEAFSESWSCLEKVLENKQVPKDAPVLTYCTGGIRCVKINAYMRQQLGYTNVYGLQHGIIGYQSWLTKERGRELEEKGEAEVEGEEGQADQLSSLFEGENFLFDRRRLDKMQKYEEGKKAQAAQAAQEREKVEEVSIAAGSS